mmetsp:Transcript_991/g.1889  ORF Transcript_991/g.1889 Transcript_991/m.1889 type:complete len:263 (+) Transcript_991:852-1640(+)
MLAFRFRSKIATRCPATTPKAGLSTVVSAIGLCLCLCWYKCLCCLCWCWWCRRCGHGESNGRDTLRQGLALHHGTAQQIIFVGLLQDQRGTGLDPDLQQQSLVSAGSRNPQRNLEAKIFGMSRSLRVLLGLSRGLLLLLLLCVLLLLPLLKLLVRHPRRFQQPHTTPATPSTHFGSSSLLLVVGMIVAISSTSSSTSSLTTPPSSATTAATPWVVVVFFVFLGSIWRRVVRIVVGTHVFHWRRRTIMITFGIRKVLWSSRWK